MPISCGQRSTFCLCEFDYCIIHYLFYWLISLNVITSLILLSLPLKWSNLSVFSYVVCFFFFFFFVLDWLKSSFGFSHSIFWKNLKEHFGQPNILFKEYFPTLVIIKILSCIWFLKVNSFFFGFGCAGSSFVGTGFL